MLLGLGLAAVPVILHFLLRQKPKKLDFPALRLVQQRQRQSVRRLRLRHFWLMVLRVLALSLLVLALARPSVPPAHYSLTRWEWGVLGGVIAAGLVSYALLLSRLRRRGTTRYQLEQGQATLRVRATLATLAALLLLVGWPYQRRIAAEITDPRPTTELNVPVAGVMLFDVSLSMSYLQAGQTALDQARDIAKAHLQSLPPGSRMAVGETSADRPIPFQSTILSAQTRIDALEPLPVSLPLEDRLREALQTHADDRRRTLADQSTVAEQERRDRYVRRIYLFTDLARSAWRTAGSNLLLSELQDQKNINLYVIDVGRTDARNRSVTDVSLSGERIPIGGDLVVTATAQSQGQDAPQQVLELLFQTEDGEALKQGQATAQLDTGVPARTEFPVVSGLTRHWIHGEVRLMGTDPLAFDNTRFFTAEVVDPPQVLVVAAEPGTAREWMTALAPHDRLSESLNKFKPRFEPLSRLKELTLSNFPAVTLINCPQLSDDAWFQLGKYVEEGGGLIVVLGSSGIQPPSYNRAPAQVFLPGWLDAYQPLGEWNFSVDKRNHPLFSIYRRLESYGSFSMFENVVYVARFWKVKPAEGANVLATYTDSARSPAILERSHGKGRTVMLTTGADLPDNVNQRWSNLPSPVIDAWLFLSFVEQMTGYVSRFSEVPRSFLSGQSAAIPVPPAATERSLLLKQPNLKQSRHVLPAQETTVTLPVLSDPGNYQLIDAVSKEPVGGFSVNVPAAESDLTRLTAQDLNDHLGAGRYQIAQSLEELKDDINVADLGQEIFPILLVLVVVFFCGEHLVANRFYNSGDDFKIGLGSTGGAPGAAPNTERSANQT